VYLDDHPTVKAVTYTLGLLTLAFGLFWVYVGISLQMVLDRHIRECESRQQQRCVITVVPAREHVDE
jgi:hypothetical protein